MILQFSSRHYLHSKPHIYYTCNKKFVAAIIITHTSNSSLLLYSPKTVMLCMICLYLQGNMCISWKGFFPKLYNNHNLYHVVRISNHLEASVFKLWCNAQGLLALLITAFLTLIQALLGPVQNTSMAPESQFQNGTAPCGC